MLHIKYVENFQAVLHWKHNFGFSTNSIPITTERQYKLKLVEKTETVKELM